MEWLRPHAEGTLVYTYIQPGASVDGVSGIFNERLKIKIKAPPRDGEANAAVIAFIAKLLGVPKKKVHLMRGETSRQKDLLVELSVDDVVLVLKCFV